MNLDKEGHPNIIRSGEQIDLCSPVESDFEIWAGWLRDPGVTRFLDSGDPRSSALTQKKWFYRELKEGREIFLVKTKGAQLLGTVSLSNLNSNQKTCEISYVIPVKSAGAPYAALEAVAMVAEYAFEFLKFDVVHAGNAYPGLANWVGRAEVIGFLPYGVIPTGHRYGESPAYFVKTAMTRERYLYLDKTLWPGLTEISELLERANMRESFAKRLSTYIREFDAEFKNFRLADDS